MNARDCPFCAEPIPPGARRCWHCGETAAPPERESILEDRSELERYVDEVDGFTLAYLRGAELRGALLGEVDLFAADLVAADLRAADLAGANLGSADLSRADLSRANLLGADLSNAQLAGTDLRGAILRRADLSGARYDDHTLWPEGFDPEMAGAVHAAGESDASTGRQEQGV